MPTEVGNASTRVRGSWVLGDWLKASISSLLIGGSLVAGNAVYFSAGKNSENVPSGYAQLNPCLLYESGSYLCYNEEPLSFSGAYYLQAQIQNEFSSGAILDKATVECGGVTAVANRSMWITTTLLDKSGSGGTVIKQRTSPVGTGATVEFSTGSVKIGKDAYITALFNSGANFVSTGRADCKLRVWSYGKYGR